MVVDCDEAGQNYTRAGRTVNTADDDDFLVKALPGSRRNDRLIKPSRDMENMRFHTLIEIFGFMVFIVESVCWSSLVRLSVCSDAPGDSR